MPLLALMLAVMIASLAMAASTLVKPTRSAADVAVLLRAPVAAPEAPREVPSVERPRRTEPADVPPDEELGEDRPAAAVPNSRRRVSIPSGDRAAPPVPQDRDAPRIATARPSAGSEPLAGDENGPASLEQRVLRFVEEFHRQVIRDEPAAQAFLRQAYAPVVGYFGRKLPRERVLDDKRRFYARWPLREYRIRPETAAISCDEAIGSCRVAVVVDYAAESPARRAISRGVTTSALVLDVGGASFRILTEDEPRLRSR